MCLAIITLMNEVPFNEKIMLNHVYNPHNLHNADQDLDSLKIISICDMEIFSPLESKMEKEIRRNTINIMKIIVLSINMQIQYLRAGH